MSRAKSVNNLRVLIAGGGTGGHIFTGIAMAEYIKKNYPDTKILFVGTRYGLEKRIVPAIGFKLKFILVRGLKGKGLLQTIRNLIILPIGIVQSWFIVTTFKPDIILGVGGYASGPVGIVKSKKSVLIIIEQNSVPGLTNRMLAKKADFAAIAYEKAEDGLECKTILSGVPLRDIFFSTPLSKETKKKKMILILGGSQGARNINTLVINSIKLLNSKKNKIRIVHQTGELDYQRVKDSYNVAAFEYEVIPFIDNVIDRYGEADLVIGRAGAITTAEIIQMEIPSILIPLPNAIYNHQYFNAHELAEKGGSILLEEKDVTPEIFKKSIEKSLSDSGSKKMKAAVREIKKGNPAEIIMKKALEILAERDQK
ncbi:MAG: undecaprenyldiphospho-muramoylpentapeptide beta-N-acetylglucosaminyltransferase [Acidobacteria bacterium]|nr:undecaprenyldiphospho-muramoylpentapeptide beta-N-acetylglucosaminyltransferase [Acidobacteriota bacterium]